MIDLHSHIIYGVDDGARNIEDSLELLRVAEQNGVTDILLTPHFTENLKNANKNITKIYEELNKRTNINLYLGNEIQIYEDVVDDLKKNKVNSINKGRYVLIELYKHTSFNNVLNIIHELKINGYIPIIAHPERYETYLYNYDFFYKLKDMGCLLQGNYASLFGYYGRDAKKMLKYMLKHRMIDCLASDIHRPDNHKYEMLKKIPAKTRFICNKTYLQDILVNNPSKIINNCEINDN